MYRRMQLKNIANANPRTSQASSENNRLRIEPRALGSGSGDIFHGRDIIEAGESNLSSVGTRMGLWGGSNTYVTHHRVVLT